eukprot:TRINITY_DN43953_c0_g1_i1.p2 TRINITY_DN43953_c0_g1~~TRINITY_DN43953_c0_g1_i1.p2  ORF type:complete len:118 (+),score=6.04 TRINITY_DN43953_c0_g1_i1:103-456(+)
MFGHAITPTLASSLAIGVNECQKRFLGMVSIVRYCGLLRVIATIASSLMCVFARDVCSLRWWTAENVEPVDRSTLDVRWEFVEPLYVRIFCRVVLTRRAANIPLALGVVGLPLATSG